MGWNYKFSTYNRMTDYTDNQTNCCTAANTGIPQYRCEADANHPGRNRFVYRSNTMASRLMPGGVWTTDIVDNEHIVFRRANQMMDIRPGTRLDCWLVALIFMVTIFPEALICILFTIGGVSFVCQTNPENDTGVYSWNDVIPQLWRLFDWSDNLLFNTLDRLFATVDSHEVDLAGAHRWQALDGSGEDESGEDESGEDESGEDESGEDASGEDASGEDASGEDASGEEESGDGEEESSELGEEESSELGEDDSGDNEETDVSEPEEDSVKIVSGDDSGPDDSSEASWPDDVAVTERDVLNSMCDEVVENSSSLTGRWMRTRRGVGRRAATVAHFLYIYWYLVLIDMFL